MIVEKNVEKMNRNGACFVLIGPPGAGKTTQGHLLSKWYNGTFLSVGTLLRKEAANDHQHSDILRGILNAGGVVPTGILSPIIVNAFKQMSCNNELFIDFGGTVEQCVALENLLGIHGKKLISLIHIQVPDSIIKKRLALRKREDDKLALIEKRLKIYRNDVASVIDYYTSRGKIISISGKGSEHDVSQRILTKITTIQT